MLKINFAEIIKQRINSSNYGAIVLYGEAGSGKNLLCELVMAEIQGARLKNDYAPRLLCFNGKYPKRQIKKRVVKANRDAATNMFTIFSMTDKEAAIKISSMFDLDFFDINTLVKPFNNSGISIVEMSELYFKLNKERNNDNRK